MTHTTGALTRAAQALLLVTLVLINTTQAFRFRAGGAHHVHHRRSLAAIAQPGIATITVVPLAAASPTSPAQSTSSTPFTTYTLITPSPSAAPVAITTQSQVMTTYIPQMTLCAIGLIPVTQYAGNISRTAPFMNYSTSVSLSLSQGCSTSYAAERTTVCATTLRGLATAVAVTACDQVVTFSSQYGYTQDVGAYATATGTGAAAAVATPSPITTQTTFYVAAWQALASGLSPANVTERVCSMRASTRRCVDYHQAWSTTLVTMLTASTSHVDLTTTIPGPSRLIIETFHADITETMTVFSLSTVMVVQVSTQSLSTVVSTVPGGPAVTTTYTLDRVRWVFLFPLAILNSINLFFLCLPSLTSFFRLPPLLLLDTSPVSPSPLCTSILTLS